MGPVPREDPRQEKMAPLNLSFTTTRLYDRPPSLAMGLYAQGQWAIFAEFKQLLKQFKLK